MLFVVLLQFIIVIACLRILYIYPSSANVPFFVGAHVTIIKLLIDALYTNYSMFKENKPVNVQPQFFYNNFIYLLVYILVICILNGDVAYAMDEREEPQPSSPIGEGQSLNRASLRDVSMFGAGAGAS